MAFVSDMPPILETLVWAPYFRSAQGYSIEGYCLLHQDRSFVENEIDTKAPLNIESGKYFSAIPLLAVRISAPDHGTNLLDPGKFLVSFIELHSQALEALEFWPHFEDA